MANGFPILATRTRGLLEQCIIDQFVEDEVACGNNPFGGLLRLGFHDCATSDPTNTSFPGGCNAWSSIHCSQFDACEFTSFDNIGLRPWILRLDNMYETAQLDGTPISQILSRADFWHLASHRVIVLSSNNVVDPQWVAGRKDPQQLFADPTSFGPRFPHRLPEFFAFSEMERVCGRNNMDNFDATALLGAHTLGHAHPSISGFRGSWDPTPTVFDNLYWQVLQGNDWFVSNIQSVNSVTGQTLNSTQYSLAGVNNDRSIQLFVDVDQLVDSQFPTPVCSHVKVFSPGKACPLRNPEVFGGAQGVLQAWATTPSTFFSAFSGAWQEVSKWGCNQSTNPPQCRVVNPQTTALDCGSNTFRHTCSQNFNDESPPWQ
jgi:hypothetical protein